MEVNKKISQRLLREYVQRSNFWILGSTGNEWLLLPDHWLVLGFRDLEMQDARTQAEARAPARKDERNLAQRLLLMNYKMYQQLLML